MNTNILDFGVIPNSSEICTSKIQAAIDHCAATGGGRVTVPAGLYISGSIWLRSHVELHLEHGAVIKGSTNMADYNEEDAFPQNMSSPTSDKWLGKHLVLAVECEDVAVTGTGTLDGSGDAFFGEPTYFSAYVWNEGGFTRVKDPKVLRPGPLLCIVECQRVTVKDITITNQPCWGCLLYGCDYVTVNGLKTRNPHYFFNSDGIDIDCCRYVTVSDCLIDTGDDAIAVRGNATRLKNSGHTCEYITITNCVLGSCSSTFRIGVGKNGTIRHIRISNITVTRGAPLIQIQSSYMGWGDVTISDVSFSNISAANCPRVFMLDESADVKIQNITMENIRVETQGYFDLSSNFPDSVSNITFRNWDIILREPPEIKIEKDYVRRGTHWFRARNINGLKLEGIRVFDDGNYLAQWEGGMVRFDGCEDRKLADVTVNGLPVQEDLK